MGQVLALSAVSTNNEVKEIAKKQNKTEELSGSIFTSDITVGIGKAVLGIGAGLILGKVLGKSLGQKLAHAGFGKNLSRKIARTSFGKTLTRKLQRNRFDFSVKEDFSFLGLGLKKKRTFVAEKIASPVKSVKAHTPGHNLTSEEREYYKDILKQFDDAHPEKAGISAYEDAFYSYVKKHINGDTSMITYTEFKSGAKSDPTFLIETQAGKRYVAGSDYYKIKEIDNEFLRFCNGEEPSIENFKNFLEHRDMMYVKEHGIDVAELKRMKIAKSKGEAIQKAEKAYHDERQALYSRLWRSYPTEPFYRIVDENELRAILRGEKMVGKAYAHYGLERVDISSNPYYDRIPRDGKFRISFKMKTKDGRWNTDFTQYISECKPEYRHYTIPSYTIDDVNLAETTAWDGWDWVPVKFV